MAFTAKCKPISTSRRDTVNFGAESTTKSEAQVSSTGLATSAKQITHHELSAKNSLRKKGPLRVRRVACAPLAALNQGTDAHWLPNRMRAHAKEATRSALFMACLRRCVWAHSETLRPQKGTATSTHVAGAHMASTSKRASRRGKHDTKADRRAAAERRRPRKGRYNKGERWAKASHRVARANIANRLSHMQPVPCATSAHSRVHQQRSSTFSPIPPLAHLAALLNKSRCASTPTHPPSHPTPLEKLSTSKSGGKHACAPRHLRTCASGAEGEPVRERNQQDCRKGTPQPHAPFGRPQDNSNANIRPKSACMCYLGLAERHVASLTSACWFSRTKRSNKRIGQAGRARKRKAIPLAHKLSSTLRNTGNSGRTTSRLDMAGLDKHLGASNRTLINEVGPARHNPQDPPTSLTSAWRLNHSRSGRRNRTQRHG